MVFERAREIPWKNILFGPDKFSEKRKTTEANKKKKKKHILKSSWRLGTLRLQFDDFWGLNHGAVSFPGPLRNWTHLDAPSKGPALEGSSTGF